MKSKNPLTFPPNTVIIYADGCCKGNPGPGGWGAVLLFNHAEKKIWGGKNDTTNNQMELTAVIEALKLLTRSCDVHIYVDSMYVKNGMTSWIYGWKRKNWKTASGQPVKNSDLWWELDCLASKHNIKWNWVKGHAGNHYNEVADSLSNRWIINGTSSVR